MTVYHVFQLPTCKVNLHNYIIAAIRFDIWFDIFKVYITDFIEILYTAHLSGPLKASESNVKLAYFQNFIQMMTTIPPPTTAIVISEADRLWHHIFLFNDTSKNGWQNATNVASSQKD